MADLHKGWHSRGYLPHVDGPEMLQTITFRLYDAVPASVVEQWREQLGIEGREPQSDPRCVELRRRIEKYADRGMGACWLKQPELAQIVQSSLLHFDGQRYRIIAWCVMPNHVHVLTETTHGHSLSHVVKAWKSFTARSCNRRLRRAGTFWMPDYFDRYIRNEEHLYAALNYIEENPVKAGLCALPADWQWGSARWRKDVR